MVGHHAKFSSSSYTSWNMEIQDYEKIGTMRAPPLVGGGEFDP